MRFLSILFPSLKTQLHLSTVLSTAASISTTTNPILVAKGKKASTSFSSMQHAPGQDFTSWDCLKEESKSMCSDLRVAFYTALWCRIENYHSNPVCGQINPIFTSFHAYKHLMGIVGRQFYSTGTRNDRTRCEHDTVVPTGRRSSGGGESSRPPRHWPPPNSSRRQPWTSRTSETTLQGSIYHDLVPIAARKWVSEQKFPSPTFRMVFWKQVLCSSMEAWMNSSTWSLRSSRKLASSDFFFRHEVALVPPPPAAGALASSFSASISGLVSWLQRKTIKNRRKRREKPKAEKQSLGKQVPGPSGRTH